MSLYRSLGPMTFFKETELYSIFLAPNSTVIMQLKSQKFSAPEKMQEIMRTYSEPKKPQSIILAEMEPITFQRLPTEELCRAIQSVVSTMERWHPGRSGQLNQNLFFKTTDNQIVYGSLPLLQSKGEEKVHSLLEFLSRILGEREPSHQLLLKRLRQANTLNSITEESRYFCKIYCLNPQRSLHSNNNNNNFKRKYVLLKKPTRTEQPHQSPLKLHQPPLKLTSKAFHVEAPSTNKKHTNSLSLRKTRNSLSLKKTHNSQFTLAKCQNTIHLNNSKVNHLSNSHNTHNTRNNHNNNNNSRVKIPLKNNSTHSQSKKNTTTPINIQSTPINFNIDPNTIKELINQSFQKWTQKNTIKINTEIVNTEVLNNNNNQQNKKKLKKTGHIHMEQPHQDNIQTISLVQNCKQEEKTANQQNQQKNKINRQMIGKVSLKKHETKQYNNGRQLQSNDQQTKRIESITKIKNINSKKKEKCNNNKYKQDRKQQKMLQQLNLVGEAVASTTVHLKNLNKEIFWQLPAFFIYREFYKQRVLIQQNGHDQLKEQNHRIAQSLETLLIKCIKKIKKSTGQQKQNLLKHLNMDLPTISKDYVKFIIKEYILSLEQVASSFPQVQRHLMQIVDAWLILQKQAVNIELRNQIVENPIKFKAYLNQRLQIALQKCK